MQTLASIAFALRFFNLDDEEHDALAPYSCQNIPAPVSTAQCTAYRFPDGRPYSETVETFADGSSFARAT